MHPTPEHASLPSAVPTVFGGGMRESFDLAPVPMVLLDAAGIAIRANFRVAALLGSLPEELVGRHWSAFAAAEDRTDADRALAALLGGSRPILGSPDFSYERPDGQTAWFRCSTSAVVEEGQPPLLLVQLTDLGEELRARVEIAGKVEQHDRVAAVVSSSRNAIMATDLRGVVTTWNSAMHELLGWSAAETMGRPLADLFPGGGQQTRDLIDETIAGREIPRFATFFPRKDGQHVAVDCDASPVVDSAGGAIGFSCIIAPHDAEAPDAKVRWYATQQRLLSRMRALISGGGTREEVEEGILTAVASMTFSTHAIVASLREDQESLRLQTAMGWPAGAALPTTEHVNDGSLMGRAVRSGATRTVEDWVESDLDRSQVILGQGVRAALAVPVTSRGKIVGAIGVYRPESGAWGGDEVDYVEEVASIYGDALTRWSEEAERRRMELHDRLTGLPSLTLAIDRLEQALDRDRQLELHTGVLVLDIDNFKYVNDTLGHDVGDRLLTAVVPRLQAVVRPGDTIARLSGDEFVVVCGEREDESDVMVLAETILDAFVEPFSAAGEDYVLTVSIGLTVATPEATPQELLSDADAATFRAKELGRNRVEVFDRSLRDRVTERVRTERELRGAVDRGELSLRYQPIIDLRTGFIEGVEALVRWQHPERGLVGPGDFITIAEESGLIVGLGEWVLRTATKQAAEWLRDFDLPRPFQLSVNLSARQLGNRDIIDLVVDALAESGLPATCLALEVTESVLIEQEDAVEILTDLRARGIRIMLDDFGTGYSSLSYLRRFEVDALKIDRSFVSELGERRQDALLVSALVQMANALNIDAVAEGVETAQQAQMLRVLGCGLAQGFHFARPLTIEDATELMRRGGMVPGGKAR
ncbi:MAG: EAL domain-containing protein [Solirubrobacteraceae bacterium]|nr:EAL domain-containing protein [Solirubrobacteraceae bacterium]